MIPGNPTLCLWSRLSPNESATCPCGQNAVYKQDRTDDQVRITRSLWCADCAHNMNFDETMLKQTWIPYPHMKRSETTKHGEFLADCVKMALSGFDLAPMHFFTDEEVVKAARTALQQFLKFDEIRQRANLMLQLIAEDDNHND